MKRRTKHLSAPVSLIGWPLTLILSPARSNIITWLTAGHEPGYRSLGCSCPGSSVFVGSRSRLKGHVTYTNRITDYMGWIRARKVKNNVKFNIHSITLQIMKSITWQTCYKIKVNSRLGQARAEEKVSGDEESTGQCFTILFIPKNKQLHHILTLTYQHMTSNATVNDAKRYESHQVKTLEQPRFSIWEVGAGWGQDDTQP